MSPAIDGHGGEGNCFWATFKGTELRFLDLIGLPLGVLINCSIFSLAAWQSRWWKLARYKASE